MNDPLCHDAGSRHEAAPTIAVLRSEAMHVVIGYGNEVPEILSIGPRLDGFAPELQALPIPHGRPDEIGPMTIVADGATGYPGRPGLQGARADGSGWSPRFTCIDVKHSASTMTFDLHDPVAALGLTVTLAVAETLTISMSVHNQGDSPYVVTRLAASVPLPAHATELLTFSGRWCREFQPNRVDFDHGVLVENTAGRTSHNRMPAMFAGTAGFNETAGEVWGVQLAWSGNYALVAETLSDGRRCIQVGELLTPLEVEVEPGGRYEAPDVVVAWSPSGLSRASQAFHERVRRDSPSGGVRPVSLNTWEAVYFNHDFDTLTSLADVAASVGVERFVLDDGWFGGRRDDTAGLGDWWVSPHAWPNGLGPMVDHVTQLGMQFGLWVEPEMVNPDSDLYRAHPDWVLTTDGYEPLLARNQLVLDLGRADVRDFLFESLDEVLTAHEISSLKWDMNRDIVQGSSGGRAGVHGHVRGVYELIDRLRAAHPRLEIESCASGGGRADLGILRRTDRIWTSDCNDALERQFIQRGFSMLFPPEVMGAHIGPARAHTTGRHHRLGFRAATALFGQLGIEWNLLEASESELDRLRAVIELHKRWRDVFATGRSVRLDHPDGAALAHGVVAADGHRALFAYVQLAASNSTNPVPLRIPSLPAGRTYELSVVDSLRSAPTNGRSLPRWMQQGTPFHVSGAQLAERGLQMPILLPESALVFELQVTR